MELRPYQQKAIDDLHGWFRAHRSGHPVMVLPTGAGKSVVIAKFVRDACCAYPGTRVVVLAHQKELLVQNTAKLAEVWPHAPMGVASASLGRREWHADVLFAGVQSVWRYPQALGHRDLLLIDECHLVNQRQSGMYRKLIDALSLSNPALRAIGWTATAFRTGHGDITSGSSALFTHVAHETGIRELLDAGWLAPVRSKRTETTFNVDHIHMRGGEFIAGEAAAVMGVPATTAAALDEVQALAGDRKSWLVFCAGVENAENVAKELCRRGLRAASVSGQTPREERDAVLSGFRSGELQAVANANLLTTGFDHPGTDLIVMLSPTNSPGRYVQIIGRGMRPAEGKTDCMVLDFAGNIERHGPVDQVRPWQPRERRRGAPVVKACPQCAEIVPVQTRFCPECNYAFPFEEGGPRHEETASNAPVLSMDAPPVVQPVEVTGVSYHRHVKRGQPNATPTLRVEYKAGLLTYREWMTIEHRGHARRRAERWWAERTDAYCPPTVEAALDRVDELACPSEIEVDTSGRYPQVVGYRFENETADAAA